MRYEVRGILIGTLLAIGSVVAFILSVSVMPHAPHGRLWKALALLGVAMAFRAVWDWWEVDRQLAIAFVIALAVSAMGVATICNAAPDPDEVWRHISPDEADALRTRGYMFIAIGSTAALWAGYRIRRMLKET